MRLALTQSRFAQSRFAQSRFAQSRLNQLRSARSRSAQLRLNQLRSAQLRFAQSRSAQLRFAQSRSAQLRLAQSRSAQLRSAQLRSAQRRLAQLRPVRRPPIGPVSAARLSSARLPELADNPAFWPLRMVDVGRQRIAVRRPREHQSGEPAVYLHGLGGSATNWTDVGLLLADALDGEAIDLPGFGESDPSPTRDYRLSAHAAVLARYVEQRGVGPVHLVANSLGGAVSIVLAARRPELVRSLTLVSPAMPDLRPHGRMRMLLGASALPGMPRVVGRRMTADPDARVRLVLETIFGDPTVVPTQRLEQAIAEAARHGALPWAMEAFAASLRSLLLSYTATGDRSLWSQARKVLVPSLVIWGDLDRLVSVSLSQRTARALEDARLLVLPGVGHTAHMEAPVIVARALLGLVEDSRAALPSAG